MGSLGHLQKVIIIIVMLVLGNAGLGYGVEKGPFTDRKTAELIHQQLSYRDKVKEYSLKVNSKKILAKFILENGQQLTYDNFGYLLEKKTPDGIVCFFDKGYPYRIVDKHNKLISKTTFIRDKRNQLRESFTENGDRRTFRFYKDNKLYREIDHRDGQLYLRKGFVCHRDKKKVSYFETRTTDGMTSWFLLDLRTGMVLEQWRIGLSSERNWRDQYNLFRKLLAEDISMRYSDRLRQRRDSFNQTKGDLIISRLYKGSVYTVGQFTRDIKNETLIFDRNWEYIDCHDVTVILPMVKLVKLDKKVIEKIRVRNKKVFQWNHVRKEWEPYPYDSAVEKLVPIGRRGQAIIEPRYERFQWQFIANEVESYVLNTRLVIKKEIRDKIKKRWIDIGYLQPDINDFGEFIKETKSNYLRAQLASKESMSEKNLGKKISSITPEMVRELQTVLSVQVKRRLKQRQELRSRDENQLTQAEYMMQFLIPEKVLPLAYLNAQKHKLFIKDMNTFNIISFKELVVRLPEVEKKVTYKYFNKVKLNRGMLSIWEDDVEHPEKGYWRHYVMRPERDELIDKHGKKIIKVDQGTFGWAWNGKWTTDIISGKLYLTKAFSEKVTDINNKNMPLSKDERFAAQTGNIRLSKKTNISVIEKIKRIFLGIKEVTEVKVLKNGTKIAITKYQNWFGKVTGLKKDSRKGETFWQIEKYDHFKRLTAFSNHLGSDITFEYSKGEEDKIVNVLKRRNEKKVFFKYRDNVLHKIKLDTGAIKESFFNLAAPKVVLYSAQDKELMEMTYNKNGKILQIIFDKKNIISYQYNADQFTINVKNHHKKQAFLKFNNQGVLIDKGGEKQLINLVFVNYDFLKPRQIEKIYNRFVSK